MKINNPAIRDRTYTTLLLDADGTLLDFDEAERQSSASVMRTYGINPTDELIERYHQINLECWKAFERGDIPKKAIFQTRYPRFFSELGITVDADQVERLYRERLDACAFLLPGALDICAYLKEKYRLYIITNGVSSTQYSRLALSGLDQYFLDVFVSEDAGSQKPQKEYFDYCLARIPEKDTGNMLVIGDSLTSDIRGGKNAGIATCWTNFINSPEPSESELLPDYEIHDLNELKYIL